VVVAVVGDVLAEALLAAALQAEGRRAALEAARDLERVALEPVAVDGQRELGDPLEGAHRGECTVARRADRAAGEAGMSRAMATATAQTPLPALTERLEGLEALDAPGKKIGTIVRSKVGPGPSRTR
jgi:hypothetical protein